MFETRTVLKHGKFLPLAALLLGVLPVVAHAQVFYSMPGARPVPDESPVLGMALGIGDNLFRLVGFGRFNAARTADLGLEIVYEDLDTGAGADDQHRWGGGADFKKLIVEQDDDNSRPVDAALQFGAGILAQSNYTLIKVPVGALVSRTFTVQEKRDIVPYAGVYLIMDFVDIDVPGNGGGLDSDLDVEFRAGASASLARRTSVFAALHAGNGTLFFLGFSTNL